MINQDYVFRPFVHNETHCDHWDRTWHKYPCPETDRIDMVLNTLESSMVYDLKSRTIHLNPAEVRQIRAWGKIRMDHSTGLNDRKVSHRDGLFIDTIGVQGEYCCAVYLGMKYVFTVDTFLAPDLNYNIEVRTRTSRYADHKVRDKDKDERKVVMAISKEVGEPTVMRGWIWAHEGKQYSLHDPFNFGMPYHSVPQSALYPMITLKELICQEMALEAK